MRGENMANIAGKCPSIAKIPLSKSGSPQCQNIERKLGNSSLDMHSLDKVKTTGRCLPIGRKHRWL